MRARAGIDLDGLALLDEERKPKAQFTRATDKS
jgi:hypothetical protein